MNENIGSQSTNLGPASASADTVASNWQNHQFVVPAPPQQERIRVQQSSKPTYTTMSVAPNGTHPTRRHQNVWEQCKASVPRCFSYSMVVCFGASLAIIALFLSIKNGSISCEFAPTTQSIPVDLGNGGVKEEPDRHYRRRRFAGKVKMIRKRRSADIIPSQQDFPDIADYNVVGKDSTSFSNVTEGEIVTIIDKQEGTTTTTKTTATTMKTTTTTTAAGEEKADYGGEDWNEYSYDLGDTLFPVTAAPTKTTLSTLNRVSVGPLLQKEFDNGRLNQKDFFNADGSSKMISSKMLAEYYEQILEMEADVNRTLACLKNARRDV
ncbi:Oidioi.mRNA.OKI2018_I69.chr1.g2769.t1.cds [Oikopleura dioica]|uniref:Oidioi.mRNA.OKI2018_I69.chr1.g2769.t1.cds n=1 Tax=Oikopleura dioica TaxID=34765 RepID=A0ABN7SS31_OIKDI|nr:Oidioi.mRNA.OKI2018_I69.chr1.g2769.t1.cds [Oikopleura dioica]